MSYTASMYEDILSKSQAAVSDNTVAILTEWKLDEIPEGDPQAAYNPLDTTWEMPGATPFNTFGNDEHVWNYPSQDVGAQATANTLMNGRYPAILAALRSDLARAEWNGNQDIIAELRVWGTVAFADKLAAASPPAPLPTPAPEPAPAPAPEPAPAPTPEPAVPTPGHDYVSVEGDSFWKMAVAAYAGDGNDWPAIWQANGGSDTYPNPSVIPADATFHIPVLGPPAQAAPPPPSSVLAVVTVSPGESLWAYAAHYYGNGALYPKIAAANEAKYPSLATNPGLIDIGWVLTIPE